MYIMEKTYHFIMKNWLTNLKTLVAIIHMNMSKQAGPYPLTILPSLSRFSGNFIMLIFHFQIQLKWSLQNFAHDMTGEKFVMI